MELCFSILELLESVQIPGSTPIVLQNLETPYRHEGEGDISENGTINAPNTPHARARSQDSSFTYEKENNDNSESEDLDDFNF